MTSAPRSDFDSALAHLAQDAKAWPFAEARNVIKRLSQSKDDDLSRPVIFETGWYIWRGGAHIYGA